MSDTQAKRTMPRILISLLITLVIGAVWFYVSLPAINLQNTGFYSFIFVLLLVYILVFMIALGVDTGSRQGIGLKEYLSFAKNQCKAVVVIVIALAAVFIIGQIISAPILRAPAYQQLLEVDTGDFATEIEQVSYNEVPMLDEASTQRLGDRKLGELSDMVSQFEVSYDYTQINYQGSPVRVTSLEYGDFFKWFLNTKEGLPAYVTVDMVTQEAEVVRLSSLGLEGMRYSPSEYFTRDLMRTVRFAYPTYMFSQLHLEIDEEGTPWWVCPREVRTIGLFGGTDIVGAVLLNACTGEHVYYTLEEIPTWVDRVFSAELISQQYDYHGVYVNGFINSLIGQKDVTITTEGYNYLAMSDDVYMYTGITSVNSDQSNIGFLLSNQRTKETTYYAAPGAIETSAMASAMGVVQDLGYTATFPLLLNIGGHPTYFMSLKDSSDLVKMYAMVNVSQYQIVATGATVATCESNYLSLLQQHGIPVDVGEGQDIIIDQSSVSGTVAEIRTAVLNGNSWYYIRLEGSETFYAIAATADQNVVILNVGDSISIQTALEDEGTIINAISISDGSNTEAEPAPVEKPESTEEVPAEE
ncbi:MAG: CvpA family protein [Ruminiclostridium sp.]|nr:CvpA family protein [Ruminiclostridium sp.]